MLTDYTMLSSASAPVTIAVTSGKGGVGKTNIVVNLAVALARLHNRVAILDADFGLGNVDVLLGLTPSWHLGHLLAGERSVHDIMVPGPHGVRIIPASSGLRELTALTERQWDRLQRGLDVLKPELDFLLVDTGAGISGNVIDLVSTCARALVVTSPEPTAMVDAYALIKVLTSLDGARPQIGVIVNNARDAAEADLVFKQLEVAATRFLHRTLHSFGFVATDAALREAVVQQRAVVEHAPASAASRCFRMLATRVSGLAPLGGPGLRLVARAATGHRLSGMEAPQCA
jgi:flagellar biosynthesis protein FlhG